jgi:hypothetical protein
MLAEAGSVLPIASGVSRYHSQEAVTGQKRSVEAAIQFA